MADSNNRPLRGMAPERIFVDGSFAPNGSSAVAASGTIGPGVVTRTGVGVFTIQFNQKFVLPLSGFIIAPAQSPAADSKAYLVTAANNSTGLLLTVQNSTAGVAADIAAGANNRIHYMFTARKVAGST